ncbi:AP3-complex subunit beta-A isoform X3 [Spinacia oleracea]|uniref:AP-3 complex subunit beta n=1 Tax=Spinacia oleracea TaxID=3562 RepID=A0ABM3RLB4_SPIOL|nr:AP3-complex subunit beta-A isoform X3 [Spinacia oleracea]
MMQLVFSFLIVSLSTISSSLNTPNHIIITYLLQGGMFTQFGATADSFSKASTMVFRIGTDAHLYDDPEDVNIAPLLDSKFDSEKCEALKRLLALIAQGFDVSNFFPQVVKNVASHSLEVKKLVYVYLLHYAEKRPNEALLSINCFQKDLGDTNPLVRAWALRTMAGIRLHVTAPLVLAAINKCARDPSVYVRRCAANAVPKLNDLRLEENASAIEEIIGILLNDHSPGVVGAAAASFNSICPNNLPLIARHYKRLCEILPDVEEWGQIILIGILLRYVIASHGLAKESVLFYPRVSGTNSCERVSSSTGNHLQDSSGLGHGSFEPDLVDLVARSYTEGSDEYLSRSSSERRIFFDLDEAFLTSTDANDDMKMLLKCTSPLLWSQNSAVVLAATGVHWIMAPKDNVNRIVKPLLFVLRSSRASKYVVLCNIQVFAKVMPSLFADYYEDFFISTSETYQIKALKLDILSLIATDSSIPSIFQEFQDYIKDPDRRLAASTVAAIGLCAQRLPKLSNICLEGLLSLAKKDCLTSEKNALDEEAGILIQAVMSIKSIISQDPSTHDKILLGGKGEDQLTIKKLVSYVLELAKSDMKYDVRDRARVLSKILSTFLNTHDNDVAYASPKKGAAHLIAKKLFAPPKGLPLSEPIISRFYLPGSLSQIVLHAAPGYEPLPKPCSLLLADVGQDSDVVQGTEKSQDFYITDDSETISGSFEEESASGYSSQHSDSGSSYSDGSEESQLVNEADKNVGSLIQISDVDNAFKGKNSAETSLDPYGSGGVEEILSKRALESWLGEQPVLSDLKSSGGDAIQRSARISIDDLGSRVKPKSYTLLDTVSGQGLKVDYSFSSQISDISPLLVCVEVTFHNFSNEPFLEVVLVDEGPNKGPDVTEQGLVTAERSSTAHEDIPTLVPMEGINSLGPSQMIKRVLQVRFHHHLLPLKLSLQCNGQKYPVKLRPDIGYFIKPLKMDVLAFRNKELQLPGMFEYVRRCTFADHLVELSMDKSNTCLTKDAYLIICENIAIKMLSNANLFLVSVDLPLASKLDDASGLCLRFSAEILSSSVPCLITITVEGTCSEPLNISVKINCEETVFGLNLLNRVVNFLTEPSPSCSQ